MFPEIKRSSENHSLSSTYQPWRLGKKKNLRIKEVQRSAMGRFVYGVLDGSFGRLPNPLRGHIVACIGEFFGTIMFFFLAFSAAEVGTISTRNNAGDAADSTITQLSTNQLLYISLAFGFSLAVTAWTFFRISGGLFNPAVCTIRNL